MLDHVQQTKENVTVRSRGPRKNWCSQVVETGEWGRLVKEAETLYRTDPAQKEKIPNLYRYYKLCSNTSVWKFELYKKILDYRQV